MPPIPPVFTPCSGWLEPAGRWSPQSEYHRKALKLAAYPCTVVVLRRAGRRLAAADLLRREHPSGWLVCQDQYTAPRWYACLYGTAEMSQEVLPRLLHVVLERENEGVRLYGGIEVDRQGREEWRQAWLCTPTPERAREILQVMAAREAGTGGP